MLTTYEDPDCFPSVDWDDEDLFDSFLNPIWLSNNTGDVAMHMEEGNEYNNNGTATYNFDCTQDVAQAGFSASWGTSSAIVPTANPVDMEVDLTEPVMPQFEVHHDDHAVSSSQHLQRSWEYETGGLPIDYNYSLPQEPTLAEGLNAGNLDSGNSVDTVQSHRNPSTTSIYEPRSSQYPTAASPALEKVVAKRQPAVLELVQHHKRSAREKAIGSGHFVQRLSQRGVPAKRPRVTQQVNVVARSKRVPCMACKRKHRSVRQLSVYTACADVVVVLRRTAMRQVQGNAAIAKHALSGEAPDAYIMLFLRL
ncbi:hypothetical protein LTR70_007834 [Exophiala xenobiotica]|uniref:Uncharacterized protein n=1 Tax=Lithohypha guttulata TaxID=1690604 RepID=A0ABR0K1J3_9EURO|nr:hypothetical protein LTR24_008554 [Lithohypha guttulata]KAK5312994.1 hypothetical protein LTR70_007834 [Exophiala xenobiotica]